MTRPSPSSAPGLTAVDTAITLLEDEAGPACGDGEPARPPAPRRTSPSSRPPGSATCRGPVTADGLATFVRDQVAAARAHGVDWRAVVDGLRAPTQSIWQRLDLNDGAGFLDHHVRDWRSSGTGWRRGRRPDRRLPPRQPGWCWSVAASCGRRARRRAGSRSRRWPSRCSPTRSSTARAADRRHPQRGPAPPGRCRARARRTRPAAPRHRIHTRPGTCSAPTAGSSAASSPSARHAGEPSGSRPRSRDPRTQAAEVARAVLARTTA